MFFDCIPSRTVAQVGSRTVIIRGTGTVVLGLSDDGHFMKTMVFFKGKRKLSLQHHDNIIVSVQEKGWMDEELMTEWVQLCLHSYTERKPSLLVMDSFYAHITTTVKRALKKIN